MQELEEATKENVWQLVLGIYACIISNVPKHALPEPWNTPPRRHNTLNKTLNRTVEDQQRNALQKFHHKSHFVEQGNVSESHQHQKELSGRRKATPSKDLTQNAYNTR